MVLIKDSLTKEVASTKGQGVHLVKTLDNKVIKVMVVNPALDWLHRKQCVLFESVAECS